MLWDYLNLCFEKVNTALLLRLQKADQVASSFLSHTFDMEEKHPTATPETSMAVAASTNQTSAPDTVSLLFAMSFRTVNRHRNQSSVSFSTWLVHKASVEQTPAEGQQALHLCFQAL